MDFCDIVFCDFVGFYYEMGKEIFVSKTPVLGYLYSPFFALILGFFGLLPLSTSTVFWVILLLVCTAGVFFFSYTIALPRFSPFTVIVSLAVFLLSYPVLHNFKWGQVGALLVLLLLLSLQAYEKGNWILATFLIAAATSLKYYPVLFILPFLFKKDWRSVFAFAGWCFILLVFIPALVLGVETTLSFLSHVYQGAREKQIAVRASNSQFVSNVVMRWIPAGFVEEEIARMTLQVLGLLVVELNLALSFLLVWIRSPKSMQWSFVLLFLSVPFLVGTSWPHYFLFLPFCQLFLYSSIMTPTRGARLPRRLAAIAGLLVSIIASSLMMLQVVGGWKPYNYAGLLFISDLILLGMCYRFVIPRTRVALKSLLNPYLRSSNET